MRSGDPAYFYWNNWKKAIAERKTYVCKGLDECEFYPLTHHIPQLPQLGFAVLQPAPSGQSRSCSKTPWLNFNLEVGWLPLGYTLVRLPVRHGGK